MSPPGPDVSCRRSSLVKPQGTLSIMPSALVTAEAGMCAATFPGEPPRRLAPRATVRVPGATGRVVHVHVETDKCTNSSRLEVAVGREAHKTLCCPPMGCRQPEAQRGQRSDGRWGYEVGSWNAGLAGWLWKTLSPAEPLRGVWGWKPCGVGCPAPAQGWGAWLGLR